MSISPLLKLENGSDATAEVFNVPLYDADGYFEELDERAAQNALDVIDLDERIDTLEGQTVTLPTNRRVDYIWKDTATITVKAGNYSVQGQPITIENDIDVTFANLDTGSEQASKFYHLWIEKDDPTTFKLSLSGTSPTGMTSPLLIEGGIANNAASNIIEFVKSETDMFYSVGVTAQGSDETEIYDASLSTSFVDFDCSKLVPYGKRMARFFFANGGNSNKARVKGSTATYGLLPGVLFDYEIMVDDNGLYQRGLTATTATHRESVIGYRL